MLCLAYRLYFLAIGTDKLLSEKLNTFRDCKPICIKVANFVCQNVCVEIITLEICLHIN